MATIEIDKEDISEGSGKAIEIDGKQIAVFNVAGRFYAISGDCPHLGGPLGEGQLEEECVVRCPWHGWTFDVRTGASPEDQSARVKTYKVVENGDKITVTTD